MSNKNEKNIKANVRVCDYSTSKNNNLIGFIRKGIPAVYKDKNGAVTFVEDFNKLNKKTKTEVGKLFLKDKKSVAYLVEGKAKSKADLRKVKIVDGDNVYNAILNERVLEKGASRSNEAKAQYNAIRASYAQKAKASIQSGGNKKC